MELSGFLIKMTKFVLDTLVKTTNADIRLHGKENIPDQPVLYVINHFTRMETFFLPYIISNLTGKNILSLAFHGFFGGAFGNYLSRIGAVSTKAPDRYKVMIGSLLKGDVSCIIFPEGQMIKDKKIIEKGKYMIYNTGIRRPPHTGAAIIALRSQFFREKLRYFFENNLTNEIQEYMSFFEIDSLDQVEEIINQETYIVPVNLTYFPVRARLNIINKIAERFVETISERLEEELEIEGTMLIDGVDIDINFGEPIPTRNYLDTRSIRKKITNKRLYLNNDEIKKEIYFKKQGIDLMYNYMKSIYKMTTVNHDHIFSYLLTKYTKNKIPVSDFKNRAYLAINRIKELPMTSYHSSLMLSQRNLLTDDEHVRYNNIIETALSEGLLSITNGYIIKKNERFSRPYEFHTIRRDNTIEVLCNEIEPLKGVTRCLNRVMRIPACQMRRIIRREFLKSDREIFEGDYNQYFIEGETKPKNIGSPFFLKKSRERGILLIHGYMAAPEEIRMLADYLYGKRFTVYGVRLRGHGTAPEDLAIRTWDEWYESVNRGYVILKNSVKQIAVAGFSTGAGLALLQAINKEKHINCVISINAPLRLNNIASRLASAVVFWNNFLKRIHIKRGEMEFVTNRPENPHINYFRNPIQGVYELEKLMKQVEEKLPELMIPSLVIQGSEDPVVNPVSGMEIFDKIGTKEKELYRIYSERHGIIRGDESEKVFQKVEHFLNENM